MTRHLAAPLLVMLAGAGVVCAVNPPNVAVGDRYVEWETIDCPGSTADRACSYTNTGTVAIGVSLFFQVEDQSGAGFSCADGAVTYCARSWSSAESGSAGDCYFILEAGDSFKCSGRGTGSLVVLVSVVAQLAARKADMCGRAWHAMQYLSPST